MYLQIAIAWIWKGEIENEEEDAEIGMQNVNVCEYISEKKRKKILLFLLCLHLV